VRHQTLWAAVAWSYGLLESDEQALFRALSVFVGGFTLEAAEAVVQSRGLAAMEVLECIQSLVDKSLVQATHAETADERTPRFRMLETIREFGLEKLSTSGEFDVVQEQHARFFIALVGQEEANEMAQSALRTWLDRLEADHDNIRASLHWSGTAAGEAETGPRLTCALMMFWYVRGYFGEGRDWYERFLADPRSNEISPSVRAKLLWSAAFVAWRQGDYQAARRFSDESVALCRDCGHDRVTVMALAVQGQVACHQSRYAVAHATVEQGLEFARATDENHGRAWILGVCGVLAYLEGNYPFARSCSQESLEFYQEHLIPMGTTVNLENLGCVARRLGNNGLARSLHEESLNISRSIGDRAATAQSLANLGHVARAASDIGTARERYTESLLISRELGDRRGVAITCGNLGVLALRAGDPEVAREWLNESVVTARLVGDKRILGAALRHLAGLEAAEGDQRGAVAIYTESIRVLGEAQDRWGIARAINECCEVTRATARPECARQLRTIAEGLLDAPGGRRSPLSQDASRQRRHRTKKELRSAAGSSERSYGPEISRVVARALALLTVEPAAQPDGPDPRPRDLIRLSRREREVAALVARGLTNREIAAELVITERTAGTHVSNVLGKLGARTRSQIAAWAVERDLRAQ
jgi:predicted ATPase/DNA-binding CsgD family transcriptional regulator